MAEWCDGRTGGKNGGAGVAGSCNGQAGHGTTVGGRMIPPFMSDLLASSSAWWPEVLRVADECYQRWLNADPLERLRLQPEALLAFARAPWLRIEGPSRLVEGGTGIPSKRTDRPAEGGQVDQRIPSGIGEWLSSLKTWRTTHSASGSRSSFGHPG